MLIVIKENTQCVQYQFCCLNESVSKVTKFKSACIYWDNFFYCLPVMLTKHLGQKLRRNSILYFAPIKNSRLGIYIQDWKCTTKDFPRHDCRSLVVAITKSRCILKI